MVELGHSSAHRGIKTIPKLSARPEKGAGATGPPGTVGVSHGKGQITHRGRRTTRVGERARVTLVEKKKEVVPASGGISGKSTVKSDEAKQRGESERRTIMMHHSTCPLVSLLFGFSPEPFDSSLSGNASRDHGILWR